MPAFMFLSAISNLFGVGGSSVICRAMGSSHFSRVKKASAFAFWGCILVTVFYSLAAWLACDAFIDWLGGKAAEVHGFAREYLTITVVIGGLVTALSTLLSHLIRSEGHSMEASLGIMIGGILNIALDPLFMFVLLRPGQEIIGAAVATMLSNCCSLLFFIIYYFRHTTLLSFKPSASMLEWKVVKDVLGTGLPACLMTLFENISYAVLDNLMAAYGIACQAGLGVAKKINMLAHSIVRGMSQGVLPLISFNYAAKSFRRMKNAILYSGAISVAVALLCMVINLVFSEPLVSIFIVDENVTSITEGAKFLRILCLGCPFSACAYAIISFFQATGKGMKSFSLAIMRKGVLDIPMMFLLNGLVAAYGIVMATPIADVLCCVAALILFIAFLKQHSEIEKA